MPNPNDEFIHLRNAGGVVVASMQRGAFRDENGVLAALERLGQAMEDRRNLRMVLDLSIVEYMSSAGLGRLVACLKKARKGGGDLILARVRAEILELLELMKLTQIFTICDTVEQAVEALKTEA
jgi:anti-sigma B factor antagonist